MMVVSIIALECGFLRATWHTRHASFILMTLLLSNLMLLTAPRLRRGHHFRAFWIGFDLAGLTCFGLILILQEYALEVLFRPIIWMMQQGWISESTPLNLAILCVVVVVLYNPPQLLFCGLVGWLNGRYRVRIERRRPLVSEPIDSITAVNS